MKVLKDHILRHVHNKFLRQVGTPERISKPLESNEQLLKFCEAVTKDCYVSVFYFKEWNERNPDPKTVIIDNIYLDFDCGNKPEKAYADVKTFLEVCKRSNVIPRVYFSGMKGFAVYLDISPIKLINPRETLREFCSWVAREFDLKTADNAVFGDIMRISRIPGTIHGKSIDKYGEPLYCTPLDPNWLLEETPCFDEIIEIAKKGNPKYEIKRHESKELAQKLKELDLKITARKAIMDYERITGRKRRWKDGRNIIEIVLKAMKPYFAKEYTNYISYHCPFHPPDNRASFAIYKPNDERPFWLAIDFHTGERMGIKKLYLKLKEIRLC